MESGFAIPSTYRLLLAENFAFLMGLLFVSLHQVLQCLLVGEVFLYLIVQHLRGNKRRSQCPEPSGLTRGTEEKQERKALEKPRFPNPRAEIYQLG